MLPSQLDAGKALPNQVQGMAKEEWADAMSAAAAAAEHARRAQDASNAAERYARGSNSSAGTVSPGCVSEFIDLPMGFLFPGVCWRQTKMHAAMC